MPGFPTLPAKEISNGPALQLNSVLCATAIGVDFLLKSFCALFAIDQRPYRPEKYYMRGPGPKWRAKHARGRDPAFAGR